MHCTLAKVKVLVDVAVHFEDGKVIQCDFKTG
jgi:hypothetical protein